MFKQFTINSWFPICHTKSCSLLAISIFLHNERIVVAPCRLLPLLVPYDFCAYQYCLLQIKPVLCSDDIQYWGRTWNHERMLCVRSAVTASAVHSWHRRRGTWGLILFGPLNCFAGGGTFLHSTSMRSYSAMDTLPRKSLA